MNALYHYCPNDAFLKIIQTNSIWISSLSLSNDWMEGKLVRKLLTELASEDSMNESDRCELCDALEHLEYLIEGHGFALSTERDLLSQWRGYADDGRGISIGFSKDYLDKLVRNTAGNDYHGLELKKVEYANDRQLKLMKPVYDKMRDLIASGALKGDLVPDPPKDNSAGTLGASGSIPFNDPQMDLVNEIRELSNSLFVFKPSGFQEENEWRLIAPYYIKDGKMDCCFRANRTSIIPYRIITLTDLGDNNRMPEVIIEPKNTTPKHVIERVLKTNDFNGTAVEFSKLSYR